MLNGMINRTQFTFLILISTLFLFSCTRDEIKENVFECPSSYTYDVDIKQIITKNCVGCHSPNGGYLPTLTTYAEVSNHIDAIEREVVIDKEMPWGEDDSLSNEEIQKFKCWIDEGFPKK